MPAKFTDEQRQAWDELAGVLQSMGVLTKADGAILESAAIEFATYRRAAAEIRAHGEVIKPRKGSREHVNPWLGVRNTAHKNLFRLLSVCGLTPADRSKLVVVPKESEENAFSNF